jgi:PKD repeat protein
MKHFPKLFAITILLLNSFVSSSQCDITPSKYNACFGSSINFSIVSPSSSYNSILWKFGDGDSSYLKTSNISHTYNSDGLFTVSVTTFDASGNISCGPKTVKIRVLPKINPVFTTNYTTSCPSTNVIFNNTTDSNGKFIKSWKWDFTDGHINDSMINWSGTTHIFHDDGSFNPVLYVENKYGCIESYTRFSGASNIYYTFDIKSDAKGSVCFDSNKVCFSQKPRNNAYYWLWTFDDPPSMINNTDDHTWAPCHSYTSPGKYNISFKIWEPGCVRDTTICMFVSIKGPMAFISQTPPARNINCESGKIMSYKEFDHAYMNNCILYQDSVLYATRVKVAPFVSRVDSFYCNAAIDDRDTILKPDCGQEIVQIYTHLGSATGATLFYDSFQYTTHKWLPGAEYPSAPIYYPPITNCNYKSIHDTDQYIANCGGPNLVFFPNNSQKYRLRYDIDNNSAGFTIPPDNEISMDKCKNPSYPWASDSMQYFWSFNDPYATNCTSTVTNKNIHCIYSTEITPYHYYSKSGCYTAQLKVTDPVTNCINKASIPIVMEKPDAGWDTKAYSQLDWATQLQTPNLGRKGMFLNGTPCVGQAYPQMVQLSGTLPGCARQKWWVCFDSAAHCSGYCKDSVWVDTNANGIPDKLIKTKIPQCSWIDDMTYSMMGNKFIYATGGCKTIGVIIKTGDCIDTFWYHEYKYIADLNPNFDIIDPSSFNYATQKYDSILNRYPYNEEKRLCAPFNLITTVQNTNQVGITEFSFSAGFSFKASWIPFQPTRLGKCEDIKDTSYMLCHKDSFYIDIYGDTAYTYCFIFPNPALQCGLQNVGNKTLNDFLAMGYKKKETYLQLSLKDTVFLKDEFNQDIIYPGKYQINSQIRNSFGCNNYSSAEIHVGHYADYQSNKTAGCYKPDGDTISFTGTVNYFKTKYFPWDNDLDTTQYWLDPVGRRNGYIPKTPYVKEKITWDLNGDNVFGDETIYPTGRPDSVKYVYKNPGTYNIRMKTTDSNNCVQILDYMSFSIVNTLPVVSFDINDSTQCHNSNIFNFKNKSTISSGTMTYNWNFGDGNTSQDIDATHTYNSEGVYSVKLEATSDIGCKSSLTKHVYIDPAPNADFTADDTVKCINDNIFTFTNKSTISAGNLTYKWKISDGYTSDSVNIVHAINIAGNHTVKLIAYSTNKCSDSITKNVLVQSNPYLYLGKDTTIAASKTITLDAGADMSSYLWYDNKTTRYNTIDSAGAVARTKIVWVKVTKNKCSAVDNIIIIFDPKLSVKPNDDNYVTIYPNPSSGIFTIDLRFPVKTDVELKVTDLSGRMLKKTGSEKIKSKKVQLDLNALENGNYLLHVLAGKETKIYKLQVLK